MFNVVVTVLKRAQQHLFDDMKDDDVGYWMCILYVLY